MGTPNKPSFSVNFGGGWTGELSPAGVRDACSVYSTGESYSRAEVDALIAAVELTPGPQGPAGPAGADGSDATIPQSLDTTDSPTFRALTVENASGTSALKLTGNPSASASIFLGDTDNDTIASVAYLSVTNTLNANTPGAFVVATNGDGIHVRKGANSQACYVYNTYTSDTDYERGGMWWDGNVLKFGTEATDGGSARNVELVGGFLGIGRSDPTYFIDVVGETTNTSTMRITRNSQWSRWGMGGGANHGNFSASQGWQFYVGGSTTPSMEIEADGDVIVTSGVLRIGGVTSAFPMLQHDGPNLVLRLGNDTDFASMQLKDLLLRPSSSLTPSANGDLTIEATNDTTLTLRLKGSDGTVRSGTIALS